MALSNRDRVGRAFELLATGLGPYLDRRMRTAGSGDRDWLATFAASARPPIRGPVALTDPALQLRVMADSWDGVFRAELGRADRTIVFELRDVRNRWAHNDAFTVDDAYRALDSIERLLVSVDATEATAVGASKEELMRRRFAQTAAPAAAETTLVTAPAAGLRPWREVIQPHEDVARGRFALAEFAADLSQVVAGEGAEEYADPAAFFARTYLTDGLQRLLGDALLRLSGQAGPPVVDLQTSFGGGKTHSMIALYHLFGGTPLDGLPGEVADLVTATGVTEIPQVRRAVLVGTELRPGQASVKPDGTEVGTLWGEIAWQLGGPEAFALLAGDDRTRSNPGGALREVFQATTPCLVLIDEWVAYARGLYADDHLRGGTLDTHFSFAQALTEAARAVPGVLLVASLPASASPDDTGVGSAHEVGGPGGREVLRRLRAVVGRMESSWRPATAEESFEIVRRRLFQPIDAAHVADRDATAAAFGDLYRRGAGEFPPECRERSYEDRMRAAYPIHPELFARLYEDWSTLERFQRTRGVLRLMATVVHALWSAGDQAPMILPASVPLGDATVAAELTRNLDDAWKPIIDADVDGPQSLPKALDDEIRNLGRYSAARRAARTVFLGSAPLAGTPNQGLDAARVRLGCAMPRETVAIYADALTRLADQGTYFFAGTGRYWYATQAGVSRVARDRAARLLAGDRHELHDHIVDRLQAEDAAGRRGDFAAVHAAPGAAGEVVDSAAARLVILPPDVPHMARSTDSLALVRAAEILDSRGSGPRLHANMLVFLAADQRTLDDLEQAVAEALAWTSVGNDAEALGLDRHQEGQVTERLADADRTVGLRLAAAYRWLLVPRRTAVAAPLDWEVTAVDGTEGLARTASSRLREGGGLYISYPPALLRLHLDGTLAALWTDGHVSVETVWDAYSKYTYLQRLRDSNVLQRTVADAPSTTSWAAETFAVADGLDPATGRYLGLVTGAAVRDVHSSTLLVRPDRAQAQLEADAVAEAARRARVQAAWPGSQEGGDDPAFDQPGEEADAPPALPRSFDGIVEIDPARMAVEAGRINAEVVAHLTALEGTDVRVTITIQAVRRVGFPAVTRQVVAENAATLRFTGPIFDAD